jgi:ribosomal protein S18 acetylase RimI-like enzyme
MMSPLSGPGRHLVFRRELTGPLPIRALAHGRFLACTTPLDAVRIFPALVRHDGLSRSLNLLARLATWRRSYVCVLGQDGIIACAHVTEGLCRYYPIGPQSAVLGAVWTDPGQRGRGLSEALLGRALNLLVARGIGAAYIDTAQDNGAMLAVIHRLGFGEPVDRIEPYA